ncbi:tail fiber domain-containing protein [Bacteriovorax sp. Seq25_V]|uniref:tail fiber domain-containing protein n=1 Tax=Bacteriovorax sp. Seq25_V TaxID=1201288 RepID=UPI00038A32E1|nr:tail fiber domain-containing protein [Bacteriovorax sp. Seq25_V]EQC44241.1 endosialidase chaperone [Bacteriovorax sp. Seq25_V]
MKTIVLNSLLLSTLIFSSCVKEPKGKTATAKGLLEKETNSPPVISTVSVPTSTTFQVTGKYLDDLRNAKLVQSANIYDLQVVSKTSTTATFSISSSVRLITDLISTLVISNSYGQASTPITFIINDGTITTAKIADGAVTAAKLDDMGAVDGQALIYDSASSTWAPGNISGLDFRGTYLPQAGIEPNVSPNNGDFYVVTTSVSNIDIDGVGTRAIAIDYNSGDWIVYDGINDKWTRLTNTASGNFFQRNGVDLFYTAGEVGIGTETPVNLLTLSEPTLMGNNNGKVLSLTGGTDTANANWSRSMTFGINGVEHVYSGTYGSSAGGTSTLSYYFLNASNPGSATPWASPDFVISNIGYVGINTISPGYELDVNGVVNATSFIGDGSQLTGITSTNSLTNPDTTLISADNNGDSTGEILFQTQSSTKAVITNGGSMGIGTATPTSRLDVRSVDETTASIYSYQTNEAVLNLISNSGANEGAEAQTLAGNGLGSVKFSGHNGTSFLEGAKIASTATENWTATNTGTNLSFYTTATATTGATEKVRISHDGKVGIGITAPTEALDVVGNSTFSGNISAGGSATFGTTLSVSGATTLAGVTATDIVVDTNLLYTDSTNNRVGIGTITPNASVMMQIAGSLMVDDCVVDSGSSTIAGTCSSDERFKKDIEAVDGIWSKFKELRLVEYGWRQDEFPEKHFSDHRTMGVIAQEVLRVFPDAVVTDDDGMYKVNYSKLQMYSMGAVAEQAREISKLKEENEQMKSFLCQKYTDAPFCN